MTKKRNRNWQKEIERSAGSAREQLERNKRAIEGSVMGTPSYRSRPSWDQPLITPNEISKVSLKKLQKNKVKNQPPSGKRKRSTGDENDGLPIVRKSK